MQNKPDWLVGFYYQKSGAAFYRSLDANGLIGKVRIGNVLWGMESEDGKLVEPRIIEGVTGPLHIPPMLAKGQKQINPGVQWVSDTFEKNNNPENYRGSTYVSGMQFWFLVTDVISKAVAKVGWEKLDGTAVYQSFQDERDVDLGGISHWGSAPGTRYNNKYMMFKFVNGVPTLIDDKTYEVPDLRPAKYRTAEFSWTAAGWPTGYFK
jgi:hypothetical protein